QRMTKALELIETGYSVLDTAAFVGYSNHSHFSAAFRKFHGRLPSCYLPKAGNGA
ncbi:MAG: AraC family transcriptional regulator, partial [Deltaproteobacteria bacterium]